MESWQAAFLGLVQGVTEFLPISSSGHLRVVAHFSGLEEPQTLFDVGLHVGTLLAVILYFWRDLVDLAAGPVRAVGAAMRGGGYRALRDDAATRGAWFIVVGSVPTAILGYKLGPLLESRAGDLRFVAVMFLVNGVVLLSTRLLSISVAGPRLNKGFLGMRIWDALIIGTLQGLSVTRGISRSGSTIAGALLMGVDRDTAGRFSFLLSIPAIVGATLFSIREFDPSTAPSLGMVALGAGTAMVSGLACLKLLMSVVRRGAIHRFGYYTLALGALLLLWLYFGDQLQTYSEAAFHGK